MTKNLKLYMLFCIVWSVIFFGALNWGLAMQAERWPYIAAAGIIYGVGFGIVGYILGKNDDQKQVRYGLGNAYSATSNIASAVIGSIWIVLFRPEQTWTLAIYLPILVIVGGLGFWQYKKSIKGMSNKQLFQ